MGMSAFYKDASGTHSDEDSIETIKRAKEIGVTFLGEGYSASLTATAERNVGPRFVCAAVQQAIQTDAPKDKSIFALEVLVLAQQIQMQSVLPWPTAVHLTGWPSAVVMLLQIRAMYMALSQTRSLWERPSKG
jgi:hypothetical protein